MTVRLFALFLSIIFFSGCQSGEVYISPPLTTRVVDADTGKGIGAVQVTMWSIEIPSIRGEGVTGNDGSISLPRLTGNPSAGFPFSMDRVHLPAMVRFEKQGYKLLELNSTIDTQYFNGTKDVKLVRVF